LIKIEIGYIMKEKKAICSFSFRFCAFLASALVVMTAFAGAQKQEKAVLSVRGRPLSVEVAKSEAVRSKGLMGRETLPWNEGMLFVFDSDQVLTFWMRNTKIPLSIAFLDKKGQVRDIFDMTPYDESLVSSTGPCRYALEVNRGFFEECGLVPGDRIDLGAVQ
jgi:uncharacterized membrane protein (UPF0127 family)